MLRQEPATGAGPPPAPLLHAGRPEGLPPQAQGEEEAEAEVAGRRRHLPLRRARPEEALRKVHPPLHQPPGAHRHAHLRRGVPAGVHPGQRAVERQAGAEGAAQQVAGEGRVLERRDGN